MYYISIGAFCNVKYQIDKHKGVKETLFFDRLITSMSSIIQLLECDNIHNILNNNSIVRNPTNPVKDSNSRIIIKSLKSCESIHDIPVNFNETHINDFIDKYKRRYLRIINFIKSSEKLCFIRYNKISIEEKRLFVEAVLKINPVCNFTLVNVYTTKPAKIKCERKTCMYLRHINLANNGGSHCCKSCKISGVHGPVCQNNNFKKYSVGISKSKYCLDLKLISQTPQEPDWTTDYLDWKKIFKNIEKFI
jgi:hypothetical protein